MKHILPIFTIALALTATTVVAEDFKADYSRYYYDYYSNPTIKGDVIGGATVEDPKWYTDTVQYKDFEIARTFQKNDEKISTNFYRITITGKEVKLYLTDWVQELYTSLEGNRTGSNSLMNHISEYGYRVLNEDGTVFYDENGKEVGMKFTMPDNPSDMIDTSEDKMEYTKWNAPVNRYEYSLGKTFTKGTVIELYMKGLDETVAYSYNAVGDTEKATAQGGYSDGYVVMGETIDSLVKLYPQVSDDVAAKKAMPLAGLDVATGGTNNRVYFGIYAKAVGSPLPGGLPIALVAGLFALGFWYIRRRKAIAA